MNEGLFRIFKIWTEKEIFYFFLVEETEKENGEENDWSFIWHVVKSQECRIEIIFYMGTKIKYEKNGET